MTLKALAFDTGGTILDWHGGVFKALAAAGARHGVTADWHRITNDYRRRAMKGMVGQVRPEFNFDDVHRRVLDETLTQFQLDVFDRADRDAIWRRWHELDAWPDFRAPLARLRERFIVASFTMLPTSLVIDVSRRNRLEWDAVISCEMIGVYKPHADAYLTAARWLNLPPAEILMVACHNFDLNAARACGYRSAFVRRPEEWGPEGPPDPLPDPEHDFIVDGFAELLRSLAERHA
jgi:2-haloacid dehalogenase